jgi:cytochrome c
MTQKRRIRRIGRIAGGTLITTTLLVGAYGVYAGEGIPGAPATLNPCAAKTINPCAEKTINPCAAKTLNPCAAKTLNPCAAKTLNPCAAKGGGSGKVAGMNPCNPCGVGKVEASQFVQPRGVRLASGSSGDLLPEGAKLWNDRFLGKSGLACSTCHTDHYGQMMPTFAKPYPHYVAMPAAQGGVEQVNAAEMVQFCMNVPMMSDPLPWDSRELAALTAYVNHIQADYDPKSAAAAVHNPCAMKRNPCNPCAGRRNPCSR